MLDAYWGSYVAFIHDAANRTIHVLRSPAARLPCLYTCYRGVHLFFSSLRDCGFLDELELTVNWRAIVQQTAGLVQPVDTGLTEVAELAAGDCASIDTNGFRVRSYWRAEEIATTIPLEDPSSTARELESTARHCIRAWGSCYHRVLLNLSGGIDSSILLNCLQAPGTGPEIVCLTEYSAGAASDERRFAREAAQAAGVELIERERNPNVDFRELLHAAKTERPEAYVRRLEVTRPKRYSVVSGD